MKALVAGGAGFIGSHLIDALLAEGHDVVCVDNYFIGTKANIAHLQGNPHFKLDEDVTPVAARVAMTRLLAAEDDRLAVSAIEAERPGVTYTVDTLEELQRLHPGSQLVFIVGGDCAAHIWRWRAADKLAKLCIVVAVARPGYDFSAAQRDLEASGMGFDVRYLHLDVPDVSSTQVRQRVAAGEGLGGLVPASVEVFIREHGLYRG